MSIALLDPYVGSDSLIHQADARIKLALTLLLIVAANVTPLRAWPVLSVYSLVLGVAVIAARLPLDRLLRRALIALPFALLAAVSLPFVQQGEPLLSFPIGPWSLTITNVGLLRFGNVLVKALLSILAALLLAATTPVPDTIHAMQALGMPRILAAVILLMYRYLFVLLDEAQRMMRARAARSVDLPGRRSGGTLLWRARVSGQMIGTLFLRTTERSERIYQAMLARGFDGKIRVRAHPPIRAASWLVAAAVAIGLTMMAVLANWSW